MPRGGYRPGAGRKRKPRLPGETPDLVPAVRRGNNGYKAGVTVLPPGPGRPKGSPNKISGQLREMILQALSHVGGVKYLARQANETPSAFLALIGRIIPLQIADANGDKLEMPGTVTFVIAQQAGSENRT